MSWIVIYTKPSHESRAKENLETLGVTVYFPLRSKEKVLRGCISIESEPLFPRYIFVRNDALLMQRIGHRLRNVRGVSRILKFGENFSELDDEVVRDMRNAEEVLLSRPDKTYQPGDKVSFTFGAFDNIEAVFREPDGVNRVILLFDLLSKPTKISVPLRAVKKIGLM